MIMCWDLWPPVWLCMVVSSMKVYYINKTTCKRLSVAKYATVVAGIFPLAADMTNSFWSNAMWSALHLSIDLTADMMVGLPVQLYNMAMRNGHYIGFATENMSYYINGGIK